MIDPVRTVEGTPAIRTIDGSAHGSRRPAAPAPLDGTASPHREYSLDGLMALALAVQQLETSE